MYTVQSLLVSSMPLNLNPVLIVLLVVELCPVVQHQVQVGGRVALVDPHLQMCCISKMSKFNLIQ